MNGRHGVPDTHVWDSTARHYLTGGADPGALLKRTGHQLTSAEARNQSRSIIRALREVEARQTTQNPPPESRETPAAPAPTYPAGLHILPEQPARTCFVCGSTDGLRFYLTGHRCKNHPPRSREDYYGLFVPMSHTAYDPERLARHKAAHRTALPPMPPEDSPIRGWCERCNQGWPLNSADEIATTSAIHYQVVHDDGGWLVGPRGGAKERTCGPCGGASPGGTRVVNGKTIQLPGQGEPFGVTFASARHDLCQNGDRRGRNIIRCDCQHRTGKTGQ